MNHSGRGRIAIRPSVIESRLEERLVLAGGGVMAGAGANAAVSVVFPSPVYAEVGLTPPPAAPPISPGAVAGAAHPLTLARLRAEYARQVHAAAKDLRGAITSEIGRLYADGAVPTSQQMADFNAGVAGALDATALRLSSQVALLPNSGARLVPAIQDAVLGSGPGSLASRLVSLAQSGRLSGSAGSSSLALSRLFDTASRQAVSQINHYFNTTPVDRLSVDAAGRRIPLQQYLGGQLINQVGNALGSLAQSFPTVAGAMLFPDGATGTPTQAAMNAFTTQYNNALATAAFQLGSGLSLFPGSSDVVSRLAPALLGAGDASNGLAGALSTIQYRGTGVSTAVSGAFSDAFRNVLGPLGTFFGMTGPSNPTLPITGLTNPFGSAFTGGSFFNGFNNGFATGTNTGFIGFGMAPTAFNTNFGTGFNNFVTTFNQNAGFNPSNPVTGTGIGQSNPATGVGTGTGTGAGTVGIPTSPVIL